MEQSNDPLPQYTISATDHTDDTDHTDETDASRDSGERERLTGQSPSGDDDDVFPLDNIPTELRDWNQWVAEKLVPKPNASGKYDKIPIDPKPEERGRRAKTNSPRTWGTFMQACDALAAYDGLGFVFTKSDPYVGLDLDNCRSGGVIAPWAQGIIDRCASYTEVSQSGKGLHIIGRGTLPATVHKHPYHEGAIEMYASGRQFMLTGRRVPGTPAGIADITDALAEMYQEVWVRGNGSGSGSGDRNNAGEGIPTQDDGPVSDGEGGYATPTFGPTGMPDEEVLQRCRADWDGEKFCAIYDEGDLSCMNDDDSVADFYIWNKLVFYLGADVERIIALAEQGAHYRHPGDEAKARERQKKWHRRDPAYGTHQRRAIAKLLAERTSDNLFRGGGHVDQDQQEQHQQEQHQQEQHQQEQHQQEQHQQEQHQQKQQTAEPKVRPRPAPMDAAAYYGPLGKIARGIEPYIEADSGALLVNLVVMAGIAMGRGPYVQVGAQRQHAILYTVTTGETGNNKSDGTNAPIDMVETASAINDSDYSPDPVDMPRINGLSTGEGLLWLIRDEITRSVVDKKTHETTIEIVDFGVADKRLLDIEPEFARILTVMGRDGNTLSTTIRTLYDSPAKAQSASKANPCNASEPHFGLIGQITPAELDRRMNDIELTNGFTNRFMWTYTRRMKSLPHPPDYSTVVHDHARLWIQAIERAVEIRRVTYDDAAATEWEVAYDQLRDGTRPGLPPREGMAKDVCSRSHTIVIRVSLILAALDGSTVITTAHQNAALAIWDFCERCANFLFADLAADPMANVILAALKAGRMKREQITALFSRHERASAIDHTLQQLVASGQARSYQEPTSGRPTTWWEYVEPAGDGDGDGDGDETQDEGTFTLF